MKKATPHWGLRRILSLKLSKYTVNTVSCLLGHDWKDHTERLMGMRAHLKPKRKPIRTGRGRVQDCRSNVAIQLHSKFSLHYIKGEWCNNHEYQQIRDLMVHLQVLILSALQHKLMWTHVLSVLAVACPSSLCGSLHVKGEIQPELLSGFVWCCRHLEIKKTWLWCWSQLCCIPPCESFFRGRKNI